MVLTVMAVLKWVLILWVCEHMIVMIGFFISKSFNIPVIVLRFVGGKDRPMMFLTKAKKRIENGVPRLLVRGYKTPIRDYLSENYYPTQRGKYGGLILWEFEDGLLTPSVPVKTLRGLSDEHRATAEKALAIVSKLNNVQFSFDDKLHKQLKLKAVDDVDVEFMLQEVMRVNEQYSGGWRDFVNKHAGSIAVVMIMICLVVIVALVLKEMPELMSRCASAAADAAQSNMLRDAAAAAAPPA